MMNTKALKSELIRQIMATDSEELLDKLMQLLKGEEKDFWLALSETQRNEIEIRMKQIENGQTEALDDFLNRVS